MCEESRTCPIVEIPALIAQVTDRARERVPRDERRVGDVADAIMLQRGHYPLVQHVLGVPPDARGHCLARRHDVVFSREL